MHKKMLRMLFWVCIAGLLCITRTLPVQAAPQESEYMAEGYRFERAEPEGEEPLFWQLTNMLPPRHRSENMEKGWRIRFL